MQISAFRGVRYDLGHVGSLADVVAPPYDVIDSALQDQLYKRHPANVVRLILNRPEPGDDDVNNRYSRAAKFYRNWLRDGLLFREAEPALYVYHQTFREGPREFTRRGFMARVRLERFGEGRIYPHEETLSGPKQDRLLLTRACQANLSPVFGLYPDEESAAQTHLETAIAGQTALEATDHLGVVHRLFPVSDVKLIADLAGLLGEKPIFVADGHHRYETACNYRDELAARQPLDRENPANYVLMTLVGMHDPGLIVMPTHRLLRDLPPLDSAELIARLGECFTCRVAGEGADLAETIWAALDRAGQQGSIGLFAQADQRWVVAAITEAGRRRMAEAASARGPAWRELGVSILHSLLLEQLVAPGHDLQPKYVHLVSEVVEGLETGEFSLAALVLPATVEHIRQVSETHERMPAKSTYFYPKLLSGLVINPLD